MLLSHSPFTLDLESFRGQASGCVCEDVTKEGRKTRPVNTLGTIPWAGVPRLGGKDHIVTRPLMLPLPPPPPPPRVPLKLSQNTTLFTKLLVRDFVPMK